MRSAIMLFAAAARALCPRIKPQPTRRAVVRAAKSKVNKPRYATGKAKAVFRGEGLGAPSYDSAPIALSGLPDTSKPYAVLGIETSCDDTAAAVVRSDGAILGEAVKSQHEVHAKYGGIVPGLAKEAHELAIDAVVAEALKQAQMTMSDVGAVAATVGPGLEICLRVGARKAAHLAAKYEKPFLHCHHLEAHCLVARLDEQLAFPYLALLVSGGHCQLLWVQGVGDCAVLGGTLDDALGEAYDKAARMLRLSSATGGGPALERAAVKGNATAIDLPVPMKKRRDCDFSYAGLKNALRGRVAELRLQRGLSDDDALPDQDVWDLAASFQSVAIEHVEDRLKVAFKRVDGGATPTLALVGGVAANAELRRRVSDVASQAGWRLVVPPPRLCTDNGVMVAWAAVEKAQLGFSDVVDEEVEVVPRWPFREYGEKEPVKIAVKVSRPSGERATAAA
jgi:N6-L-threonylcarbamoyladenine synthase